MSQREGSQKLQDVSSTVTYKTNMVEWGSFYGLVGEVASIVSDFGNIVVDPSHEGTHASLTLGSRKVFPRNPA